MTPLRTDSAELFQFADEQKTVEVTSALTWKILIADDDEDVHVVTKLALRDFTFMERKLEFHSAYSGKEACAVLQRHPDTAVALLDVTMETENAGLNAVEFIRNTLENHMVRIILRTGQPGQSPEDDVIVRYHINDYKNKAELTSSRLFVSMVSALRSYQDLLAKDALIAIVEKTAAELERAYNRVIVANEKLKTGFIISIKMFSHLIELGEGVFSGHSRRVAELSRHIAAKIGLDTEKTQDVMIAALLHDIGKIGMPETLRTKPLSEMSHEELSQYRDHPIKGAMILMAVGELQSASRQIHAQHERFDGLGYPDGLQGKTIPFGARIIAIANDYDSLQIGNHFRELYSPEQASDYILKWSGKRYDPVLVDAFVAVLQNDVFGIAKEDLVCRELPLKPDQLEGGMTLSRDLISRDGLLLVAVNHVLDDYLIGLIQNYARTEGDEFIIHIDADKMLF